MNRHCDSSALISQFIFSSNMKQLNSGSRNPHPSRQRKVALTLDLGGGEAGAGWCLLGSIRRQQSAPRSPDAHLAPAALARELGEPG